MGPERLSPVLPSLPSMTGVTYCECIGLNPAQLQNLHSLFPDIRDLFLHFSKDIDDIQLQNVATCFSQLTTPHLS